MPETKLIELSDGTLVEVSAAPGEVKEIAGSVADLVASNLLRLQDIVTKACRPVLRACLDMSKDVKIEQAEVELGLNFEAEGNIYITKAKGTANLSLKFVIRP